MTIQSLLAVLSSAIPQVLIAVITTNGGVGQQRAERAEAGELVADRPDGGREARRREQDALVAEGVGDRGPEPARAGAQAGGGQAALDPFDQPGGHAGWLRRAGPARGRLDRRPGWSCWDRRERDDPVGEGEHRLDGGKVVAVQEQGAVLGGGGELGCGGGDEPPEPVAEDGPDLTGG